MQPALAVRFLDFWFPILTITLVVITWIMVSDSNYRGQKENIISGGILGLSSILIGCLRYFPWDIPLIELHPPQIQATLIAILIILAIAFLLLRLSNTPKGVFWVPFVVLIGILIVIKTPILAEGFSKIVRGWNGQSALTASPLDVRWLGFSYVFFRLVHTIRDRQGGRFAAVNLREFISYVLFFPAITAGPIDRLERFVKDLRAPVRPVDCDIREGGYRIVVGLFKKFVLADLLAIFALNAQNASQIRNVGWGWILLYGYTFQIFLDFSGYSDIVIGLGILNGVKLPENFSAPYLKHNLQLFWNNWHMTLTQWFRAYFFNPITRLMKRRKWSTTLILLITQLSTMVFIGLWHGITWNFVIWGAWHGVGLFVQNRYSDWVRPRVLWIEQKPKLQKIMDGIGLLLTFHYVALGWVWFILPSPSQSIEFFGRIFRLS